MKGGRSVKLPNGTIYYPIGKKDGQIKIGLRLNPIITTEINSHFRGTWINAENIGFSEAEMIALWNRVQRDPVTS